MRHRFLPSSILNWNIYTYTKGEKNEATLCSLEDLSPTFRTDFANKLLSLREQLRALWLTRYHPQGMQGSLAAMNALLARFIPEQQAEILHK